MRNGPLTIKRASRAPEQRQKEMESSLVLEFSAHSK